MKTPDTYLDDYSQQNSWWPTLLRFFSYQQAEFEIFKKIRFLCIVLIYEE